MSGINTSNEVINMPSEELVLDNVFCNNVMYLPLKEAGIQDGDSINDIINKVNKYSEDVKSFEKKEAIRKQINYIEGMIEKTPEFKEMTISDLSWNDKNYDKNEDHPYSGMQAAVFHKKEEVYITYRGTPDGSWIDNAEIIIGSILFGTTYTLINNSNKKLRPISYMQKESLEYMDNLRIKYEEEWKDKNVHVGGHSKGDALAALVMILNSDLIDDCVGINGPGLSKEAYAELERILGVETIAKAQETMYKYSEKNDYVNVFGKHLYKESNMFFYQGWHDPKDIYQAHLIPNIYDEETGKLALLVEGRGEIGRFLRKIYTKIEDKPPIFRAATLYLGMIVMQDFVVKEKPVGKERDFYVNFTKVLDVAILDLTLVLMDTLEEEEGDELLEYIYREYGKRYHIKEILMLITNHIDTTIAKKYNLPKDIREPISYIINTVLNIEYKKIKTVLLSLRDVKYIDKFAYFSLQGYRVPGIIGNYLDISGQNRRDKIILESEGITAINYEKVNNLELALENYANGMEPKYIERAYNIKQSLKNLRNKVNHKELDNLIDNYEIQKKGLDSYKEFINEYKKKCKEVENSFINTISIIEK